MGVIFRQNSLEEKTVVVCPLSVEPDKPRAIWDGSYLNEYIRDIPFTMDGVNKVAEIAWKDAYMFKLDHKNGYFHVPIAVESRKFLEYIGKASIMSSVSYLLDGSQALTFTTL